MQMFENNQFDMDDPMDEVHGPVRLPFLKKGTHKFNDIFLQLSYSVCFR